MRILTVQPPWAQAIIYGGKNVENRPRNIVGDYRGLVAIHAGKSLAKLTPAQAILLGDVDALEPWFWGEDIVGGAIIGVVKLIGIHRAFGSNPGQINQCGFDGQCSKWAEQDCWHLELSNPHQLAEPIPYRGSLGLRTLPGDVAAQVLAGVA